MWGCVTFAGVAMTQLFYRAPLPFGLLSPGCDLAMASSGSAESAPRAFLQPGPRPNAASAMLPGAVAGGSVAIAVVAEKPSVARDIARVLGARRRGGGVLTGNGYVVTWALGHLVALAQPHEVRAEWKRWAAGRLPLLPDHWPLVVLPDTQAQFDVVASVLRAPSIE